MIPEESGPVYKRWSPMRLAFYQIFPCMQRNFPTMRNLCIQGTPPQISLKNEKLHREDAPEYKAHVLTDQNMIHSIVYKRRVGHKVFLTRSRQHMAPTKNLSAVRLGVEI